MDWWLKILIGIGLGVLQVYLLFWLSHWEKYLKHYTVLLSFFSLLLTLGILLYFEPWATLFTLLTFGSAITFLILPWKRLGK